MPIAVARTQARRLRSIVTRGARRVTDPRIVRQRRAMARLRAGYYRAYWERAGDEIGATVDRVDGTLLRVTRGPQSTYVRGYWTQLDDPLTLKIAGDKSLSRRLLVEAGIRVPRQWVFDSGDRDAIGEFIDGAGGSIVVKPIRGSAGRGVSTDVTSTRGALAALRVAGDARGRAVAEDQIPGHNYRLLYLDGELVDVVRRESPTVIGNGRDPIRRLVQAENRARLAAPPFTALSVLTLDADARGYLAGHSLSASAVPDRDARVAVKRASNQNCRRDNHRVVERIHESFGDLATTLGRVLPTRLLGIDIVAPDLDTPLDASGGAVIEINATPGLHHHDIVADAVTCDLGPMVLERSLGRCATLSGADRR